MIRDRHIELDSILFDARSRISRMDHIVMTSRSIF